MDGKSTDKVCFKCDRRLPLTDFYKHPQMGDGHLNKCKECTKRDVSENYRGNLDHYKAYERSRLHDPKRVSARREHGKRLWREQPDKIRGHRSRWAAKNGHKRAAQITMGNAIRDGKLKRQPCERCGSLRAQGHHEDYSKPLEVMWLCPKHHGERHMELRDMGVSL